ncbi:recombination regulator RecX [Lapidilactobacillus bayanensis]|uniref:recombination regulator RecX n=1 Tax=Lapidilactobacillus bayanensis TaxID=2485998 RepID=UPI000F78DCCD|nr:recombination regulator RecX [Lapidilactobacillus bayanensis]
MTAKITKITAQKRPGRYNIFLDGQYAFPVSEDVLIDFALMKDQEVDAELKKQLLAADANSQAHQLALNYLSYQLRTIKEMRTYLHDHDVGADTIEKIIVQLTEQKYLDDAEYAKAYVRTNMALHEKGRIVIDRELKQKGVAATEITDALALYDTETTVENGTKLAKKVWQRQAKLAQRVRQQKVRQSLQQKGFTGDEITLIFEQLDFSVDPEDEHDLLDETAAKIVRRYRPLSDSKQRQKFKQALARKGFNFDDINRWLEDHSE